MCGIVGALVFRGSPFSVTSPYLARMRDTMTHRGPDGAGTWVSEDGRVGLAHRRLAIIDLSDEAAQPMSNKDGTLWVSFNGEIYNHAEIRAELERIGGFHWKTDHSDTEVLLHAFAQWGIACVERFRGMFAIALWDARSRELWLIRDRIGVKPLYYSVHHRRVTFASEIKALLQDPEQARAVCEPALFQYLQFLTTPGPQTLFEGIRKLPGGTWLRILEDGTMEERNYWDVWDHARPMSGASEGEIAEAVLTELRRAVSLRKVSDVPVGVFLSGGIDSSTNAALFSEDGSGPVRTFSIGYEGEYGSYKNELEYARLMSRAVGGEHHELLLTQDDFLDFLPRMVHLQDEPIADPVCVPLYFVSKLARDHGVIVCQVGEGSDELFWGYPSWRKMLRLQQLADPVPATVKHLGLVAMKMMGAQRSRPYELLRRTSAGEPLFYGGTEAFTDARKHALLSPRLRSRLSGLSTWDVLRPIHDRFLERAWEPSHLHWMSYVDLRLRLPELLLARVDKMSMGASLEARVPFLDHKFVELALSIPANVKTRHNTLKFVLKKAVRGLIPDEIIDRRKQGFGVPVDEWFLDRLGTLARRELDEFCSQTDNLDPATVAELFARRKGWDIWFLLNLALWWKHYIRDAK
jgi:asparagine synthase (glutamine-hydrolysing)